MHSAVIENQPAAAARQASTSTSTAGSGVDAGAFRAGMSRVGGACTIITASHGDERAGLTATAVCSVSAEPPRLLVCVNRNVRAHQLIGDSGWLGVNVLDAGHQDLAKRFAGMVQGVVGADRFLAGDWRDSPHGVPVLRDALVSFECRVVEATVSGTHSIFLCEVTDVAAADTASSALVYFNRSFVPIETA